MSEHLVRIGWVLSDTSEACVDPSVLACYLNNLIFMHEYQQALSLFLCQNYVVSLCST